MDLCLRFGKYFDLNAWPFGHVDSFDVECAGSSKSVDPILHYCMFARHENELKEDHFFRCNLVIKTGMFTWLSRVKYDT